MNAPTGEENTEMEMETENSAVPPPNPLARVITYTFAPDTINADVGRRLAQIGKNARVNGFRPGHVPMRVLRDRWGGRCIAEVLAEKAGEKFAAEAAAMPERPMSSPQIVPSVVAAAEGYRVECRYEVMPEIVAPDFSAHKIRRPVLEVGAAEVDEMIDRLQRDAGEYKEVARPARADDRVTVDFSAFRGDEKAEDAQNRSWNLNSPMFKGEIADALVGASAGETREVKIKHPDDHSDESLRGTETRMEIKVNAVFELHPHPLDAAFFSRFGVDGGEAEFRETVAVRLKSEVAQLIRRSVHEQAMNALLAATPKFDLPRTLLHAEASEMVADMRRQAKTHGMPETAIQMTPQLVAQAARRVALGLIINQWREREKIEISDAETEERLGEIAASYENPEEFKTRARQEGKIMHSLRLEIMEKRATEWVMERAGVDDEKTALSALLSGEGVV